MKRILVLAALVAGCGSDNTAGIDDFIQQIATQQCAWEFRCCTDSEIRTQDGTRFTSQDGCVPYRALALQDELYMSLAAARAGRMRLDSDHAHACLMQMKAQTCNPAPGKSSLPSMIDLSACDDVFVGTTPAGDPCQLPLECEKGTHCVFNKATSAGGVCVPYQHERDICNSSDDCDPSVPQLYCAQADWKCHVRSRAGEKCQYTVDASGKLTTPLLVECDTSSTYCDAPTSTCLPLPGAGEPCLSPLPLGATAPCAAGLSCDYSQDPTHTPLCKPLPPPSTPTGSMCTGRP